LKLHKIKSVLAMALLFFSTHRRASACGGGYFPESYLWEGDAPLVQAPTANFILEIKRLKVPEMPFVFRDEQESAAGQTAKVDLEELRSVLSSDKNSGTILAGYESARERIRQFGEEMAAWNNRSRWDEKPRPVLKEVEVPAGLPAEFARYFAGSIAWHNGRTNEARTEWQSVLSLPKEKRRYRSVWAAFMLGRSWVDEDPARCALYLGKVRALVSSGMPDSLGLAAASYGWEARSLLSAKRHAKAIEGYIRALGAHDPAAPQSLQFAVARLLEKNPEALELVATNALSRRIVTAHLISRFGSWNTRKPSASSDEVGTDGESPSLAELWLEAIEKTGVRDVELAEQMALAAYQSGKMDAAQRWIFRASTDSLVTQWLQAKLLLRAGELGEAAALLGKVAPNFPLAIESNAPPRLVQNLSIDREYEYPGRWSEQHIWSELGVLQLTRREFTEAFDTLARHGTDADAAYVGERVLTLEELKTYVDRNFPALAPGDEDEANIEKVTKRQELEKKTNFVRGLLARRLTRMGRIEEAGPYFEEADRAKFEQLAKHWATGYDLAAAREERARAFWAAAELVEKDGDKLFDSAVEPYWRTWGNFHNFNCGPLTRVTNAEIKLVKASADEIRRVREHIPDKTRRFNYHYYAADLAWNAALFMPNNSDETARVLHAAGSWIKYIDQFEADVFYKALVRRCRKTELGDAADKKRWFPRLDENGKIIYPLRNPPPKKDIEQERPLEAPPTDLPLETEPQPSPEIVPSDVDAIEP
jgi:tetratricopeptide (TPR) repeat protein